MYAFVKLFAALSLLSFTRALAPGSICPTSGFTLAAALPANLPDAALLAKPVADHPVYTALSIGVQNYTCSDAGAWAPAGAWTYLYDISCLPLMHHKPFTSFIAGLWGAAPPSVSGADIIDWSEELSPGVALGLHYWVPDPVNVTSGKIFAKWDFSKSERYVNDTNKANAFLVASESGSIADPINAELNSPWLSEPILIVDGKPLGELATQVFRFNSNGGSAPNTTCNANNDFMQVKSTLNFWFYGGAWNSTIH